jgi:hypothetical protein
MPTRSRATTLAVAGSTTTSAGPRRLDVQIRPRQAIALSGSAPTLTVATTRPVAGAIFANVPFSFGTQRLPRNETRSSGFPPTWIRATTLFLAGSMRTTRPAPYTATHTAPGVARIPACSVLPTSTRATTRPVAGSTRVTVRVSKELTHTPPAPKVTPYGEACMAMRLVTRFVAGSTRSTSPLP